MTGRIVVGVDDGPEAGAALRWALREATTRGAAVSVVAAWQLPVSPLGLDPAGSSDYLRGPVSDQCRAGAEVLLTAARLLEPEAADVPVELHTVHGDAVHAIVDAGKDADLVVVGSRGRHRVRRALLGSVSAGVVKRAACPVVVVHTGPEEIPTQELAAARLVTFAL